MDDTVNAVRIALLATMLAGCASTPGPDHDPVLPILTDLEARLIRIERIVDDRSPMEAARRVEQLRSEVRVAQGEAEALAVQTDSFGERQRDLYMNAGGRLRELELFRSQLQISIEERVAQDEAAPPVWLRGSERENYRAAFNLLRHGNHGESARAFEQFLAVFPSSPLADNAQYWLAETYYAQRQYPAALRAFQRLVESYPGSSKLPETILKIGYCNHELQQWDAAREALRRVVREFPATTAARLATRRLESMSPERS